MEMIENMYSMLLTGAVTLLAILIIVSLIRSVLGPGISDRIIAVNMIGTMIIMVIAILSVFLDENYLVDICLIYAMISFLGVVVLCKVYTGVYLQKKQRKADLGAIEDNVMNQVEKQEESQNEKREESQIEKQKESLIEKQEESSNQKPETGLSEVSPGRGGNEMTVAWIRFAAAAVCLILGLVFMALAVFGVNRFHHALNRMHAAAMGDTLGILFVLSGLIVMRGFSMDSLKLLLVILFFWTASPVSGHMISRLEAMTDENLGEITVIQKEKQAHREDGGGEEEKKDETV